jgi:PPOX class probable F420-dependent enzyme
MNTEEFEMTVDFTTEFGKRVLEQLHTEHIIWLTTVSKSGTPEPNPVWFDYVDGDIFIYTQTTAVRLKNIERNNRVSLNFETDEGGERVTVLTGTATIDETFPKSVDNPRYLEKYAQGIAQLGWTPEKMSNDFPVVMRITPDKLRGW